MNVTVINGSPKGENSITLQTVNFIQKHFPWHKFTIIPAGAKIKYYEKHFEEVRNLLEQADLIIFSYPVYTFLVPSQLHRFLELMKEHQLALSGKTVSQITTSKHFYDITAHRFIQENCQDMGMNYVRGLSADMEDLLQEKGRSQALQFMNFLEWSHVHKKFEYCNNSQPDRMFPEDEFVQTEINTEENAESFAKNIVIVADLEADDQRLSRMISYFCMHFPGKAKIVNIREYPLKGGCLGCMNCVTSGHCIYQDGFENLLRNEIQTADSIIYAFTIRDHSMGSTFKMFDDRQFCNGHRTVTMGMPMGYLINGDYYQEQNLKMVLEARCEAGGNFLAGAGLDKASIDQLSETLVYALEHQYTPPQNFYGVGGFKIFRDLIYQMRGLMKADHQFFKQHQQYDFPQKKRGTILAMYGVGMLFSNSKLKTKMGSKISEGMIAPYKKVVQEAEKAEKK